MRDARTLALQQHLRNLALAQLRADDGPEVADRVPGLMINIRTLRPKSNRRAAPRSPTSDERLAQARADLAHARVRLEGRCLFRELGLCP